MGHVDSFPQHKGIPTVGASVQYYNMVRTYVTIIGMALIITDGYTYQPVSMLLNLSLKYTS